MNNTTPNKRLHATIAAITLLASLSANALIVNFPDPNLEDAIRDAINKPTGDILDIDLVGTGFTVLEAAWLTITDLTGLEYCTDLTYLNLDYNQISDLSALSGLTNLGALWLYGNQISDISALSGLTNLGTLWLGTNAVSDVSALSGLTNLTYLDLSDNEISDLSALVSNPGIDSDDGVYLQGNPLSQNALCLDIPTLEGRGATISYDGACVGVMEVTGQPVGGAFYVGNSCAMSVTVTGGVPTLTYQWRRDGSDIDGATSTDLVLDPLGLGDAGDYDCVVNDSVVDSVTSDVATVDVAEHVAITTQPLSATVMSGDAHALFVEASGGYPPLWYAWNKDGSALPGATASSYTIASFGPGDVGSYTVDVGDSLTDVMTSNPAALTIQYPLGPIAGLAALAGACLLAGAVALRKRPL